MATMAPTPKAVAILLLPALVLMLAVAFSYVGAFHEPVPHNVRVAVVRESRDGHRARANVRHRRCGPRSLPSASPT